MTFEQNSNIAKASQVVKPLLPNLFTRPKWIIPYDFSKNTQAFCCSFAWRSHWHRVGIPFQRDRFPHPFSCDIRLCPLLCCVTIGIWFWFERFITSGILHWYSWSRNHYFPEECGTWLYYGSQFLGDWLPKACNE